MKATERKLTTVNPATEEILNEYDIMTKEKITESVGRAREAFSDWKKDIHKRADSFMHLLVNLERIGKILPEPQHRKWGRQSKNLDRR